jgi:uncharacterized membrane protein YozB (DUF420 family)
MSSITTPQINLVFQIVILAIISMSFALKRMHKYFLHGITMLIGVVFNTFSFLLVMGPSLLNFREFILANTLNRISLVTLAHSVLGGVAEILAVVLVASWHLQSSTKGCMGKKKVMRITFILWVIALALGILLYVLTYTSILS